MPASIFCGPNKEENTDYATFRERRLASFTNWLRFTTFKEIYVGGVEYEIRESFLSIRNFKDKDFHPVVDDSDPDIILFEKNSKSGLKTH